MMSIMVYKTIFYVYYGKSLSTKRLASLPQRPFDSWFSWHVSLCALCEFCVRAAVSLCATNDQKNYDL